MKIYIHSTICVINANREYQKRSFWDNFYHQPYIAIEFIIKILPSLIEQFSKAKQETNQETDIEKQQRLDKENQAKSSLHKETDAEKQQRIDEENKAKEANSNNQPEAPKTY